MNSINKHSHYNSGYYLIILNLHSETGNLAMFSNSRFYSEICHAIRLNSALHYDFDLAFLVAVLSKRRLIRIGATLFPAP